MCVKLFAIYVVTVHNIKNRVWAIDFSIDINRLLNRLSTEF